MGCPWMGGGGAFGGWASGALLHLSIARSRHFHAYGVPASGLHQRDDVRRGAWRGGPFDAPPCYYARDDSSASFAGHLPHRDFHCDAYDVRVGSFEIQCQH